MARGIAMSDPSNPRQFTLFALLLAVTAVGVIAGLTRSLGLTGFLLGIDATAAVFCFVSFSRKSCFRPFNIRPWRLEEIVVVVGVCIFLHVVARP